MTIYYYGRQRPTPSLIRLLRAGVYQRKGCQTGDADYHFTIAIHTSRVYNITITIRTRNIVNGVVRVYHANDNYYRVFAKIVDEIHTHTHTHECIIIKFRFDSQDRAVGKTVPDTSFNNVFSFGIVPEHWLYA